MKPVNLKDVREKKERYKCLAILDLVIKGEYVDAKKRIDEIRGWNAPEEVRVAARATERESQAYDLGVIQGLAMAGKLTIKTAAYIVRGGFVQEGVNHDFTDFNVKKS